MESQKSVAEIEMEEILNECELILDETPMTIQDAKEIMNAGCKLLEKCKELRLSRDNHAEKRKYWEMKYKKLYNEKERNTKRNR